MSGRDIIQAQLKSGDLKQVYLFFGEEEFLKEYYFDELKKNLCREPLEFNFALFEGDKIAWTQVDEAIDAPPLMAEKKLVTVRDSGIFKSHDAAADAYWKQRLDDLPEYVCVVFYEKQAKKNTALYKAVKKHGEVLEFPYLKENELLGWVVRGCQKQGLKIDRAAAKHLIRVCDGSMSNIKRELEKLFSYCNAVITKSDIDKIAAKMPQARVFEMINAIMKKDGHSVFMHLGELKTLKESPFLALALLCTSFERILHAKLLAEQGAHRSEIATQLGVPPFFVNDYTAAARCFSKPFLRQAICECAEIDFAVKQGKIDVWLAIEQFLAQCVAA